MHRLTLSSVLELHRDAIYRPLHKLPDLLALLGAWLVGHTRDLELVHNHGEGNLADHHSEVLPRAAALPVAKGHEAVALLVVQPLAVWVEHTRLWPLLWVHVHPM